MSALALIVPLLIASTHDCYLVTGERIERIPCNFDAVVTDALRYAAEDAAAERRNAQPQRTQPGVTPRFAPRTPPPFARGSPPSNARR